MSSRAIRTEYYFHPLLTTCIRIIICSVGKRSGHIPYRNSKLTRILQHSLGGNARTAIICTLSPALSHMEQSRNTLLFATRAKEVTNSAQVNMVTICSQLANNHFLVFQIRRCKFDSFLSIGCIRQTTC